jgi:hypothetical protein
MGSSELSEWRLFWEREPWGPYRDNFHAAMICSLIANAFRGKGKAVSYQDFMLVDREAYNKKKTGDFISWMSKVAKPKKKKLGNK